MRFNMKIGAVVMATVIALTGSLVMANQAWAQDGTAEPTDATTVRQAIRQEFRQAGIEAAAGALGMTPEEVEAALDDGKSLADLAETANVELSDVRAAVNDALKAERQELVKEFIAKQVENGRMTQEHADWLNEGIDKGWFGDLRRFIDRFEDLGGENFGLGRGRAWNHMHAPEQSDE